jgi:hypothetical protein
MTLFFVKNVPDSGHDVPPSKYKSWIDFWEKHTGLSAGECKKINCHEEAEDGGHVYVLRRKDMTESGETKEKDLNYSNPYIVPLCKPENHPSNEESYWVEGPLVNRYIDDMEDFTRLAQLNNKKETDKNSRKEPEIL